MAPPLLLRVRPDHRPAWTMGPQAARHADSVELCLIEDGTEHLRLDGGASAARTGEYELIPAGCEHSGWTERQAASCTLVHFQAAAFAELQSEAGAARRAWEPGVFVAGWPLKAAIRRLEEEARRDDPVRDLLVELTAHEVALRLVRAHLHEGAARGGTPSAARRRGPS
jgi:hypothetical protein